MAWIECVRCEKLQRDFVAWTSALIAPVHPVLHWVSCSYVTIRNAPKHYERLQNMSLGSNGVDQVCSLRKLSLQLCGTNFCSSSAYIAPSFVRQPNGSKYTRIAQNAPKHEFRVQWGWIGCVRCEKFRRDFVLPTFALVLPVLHRAS